MVDIDHIAAGLHEIELLLGVTELGLELIRQLPDNRPFLVCCTATAGAQCLCFA